MIVVISKALSSAEEEPKGKPCYYMLKRKLNVHVVLGPVEGLAKWCKALVWA
jgi:hypothetical protein